MIASMKNVSARTTALETLQMYASSAVPTKPSALGMTLVPVLVMP